MKAFAVTGGAAFVAVLVAPLVITDWREAAPLLLFHAVLLLNTYFSIRCFSRIIPPSNRVQRQIDIGLFFLYLALPFSFGNPRLFVSLNLTLFIIATLKYVHLGQILGPSKLVRRKIRVDAFGILFCLAALFGVIAGHAFFATVLFASIFLAANVYFIFINPLYKNP